MDRWGWEQAELARIREREGSGVGVAASTAGAFTVNRERIAQQYDECVNQYLKAQPGSYAISKRQIS